MKKEGIMSNVSPAKKYVSKFSKMWKGMPYLIQDLTGFLSLFYLHGAKGDPRGSLGVVVVVGLVLIL